MRRFSLLLALAASLAMALPAMAAAPPSQTFNCEAGGNATATRNGAQGCEFVVGAGGAAFAYHATARDGKFYPTAWDKPLSQVTQLSFLYSGSDPAGALRWSLQLEDGSYVFVGADRCNNGAGLVDVINDPTCVVAYNGVEYANWAAFVAANPGHTLYFAFVVADQPGTWNISSVKTKGK
jgi:hypothetical protein